MAGSIIDSHVHVWPHGLVHSAQQGSEPLAADPADLVATLDASGVAAALGSPAMVYPDNGYVLGVAHTVPARFGAVVGISPRDDAAIATVAGHAATGAYAVRVNLGATPLEGAAALAGLDALADATASAGVVLQWTMRLPSAALIERVAARHPDLPQVFDHLGLPVDARDLSQLDRIRALAAIPRLHIKLSGMYALSQAGYPYEDVWPWAEGVLEAFGARRTMWASDWPLSMESASHADLLALVGRLPFIDAAARAEIPGRDGPPPLAPPAVIGPRELRGLWAFALTPFAGDGIDEAVYRTGVRTLVEGRADVVIAAGTLGQGDRMTAEERQRCLALARSEAGSTVPVLGVIVADGTAAAAAEVLVATGADGALLLPASEDVAAMAAAIDTIARATGGRLPLVVYQRGDLRFEPDSLRELAERPALIGLKDAHGDLRRFRRLREAVGDRLVWIGASEDLAVAYRTHGADAVSPASMAYRPAYARTYWTALDDGDVGEAIRLLRAFAWPVTDLRYSRPEIDISVVREFATVLGQPVGAPRSPARPLVDAEIHEVARLAGVLETLLADG